MVHSPLPPPPAPSAAHPAQPQPGRPLRPERLRQVHQQPRGTAPGLREGRWRERSPSPRPPAPNPNTSPFLPHIFSARIGTSVPQSACFLTSRPLGPRPASHFSLPLSGRGRRSASTGQVSAPLAWLEAECPFPSPNGCGGCGVA